MQSKLPKSIYEILKIEPYIPKDKLSLLFTEYSTKSSDYFNLKGCIGFSSLKTTETLVIPDACSIKNVLVDDSAYKDLYGSVIDNLINGLVNLDMDEYINIYGDKALPLVVLADLSESYSSDIGKIKCVMIDITPQHKKGGIFVNPKKCFKIVLHEARGIYITSELIEALNKKL